MVRFNPFRSACFVIALALASPPLFAVPATTTLAQRPGKTTRPTQFYALFREVFADFEYDLQNDGIPPLKRVALWRVTTGPTVPPTFRQHVTDLVAEALKKKTGSGFIPCPDCRIRGVERTQDGAVIPSPQDDLETLTEAAKRSKVEQFMEVSFTQQHSGLLLAFKVFRPKDGSVVWARNYQSNYTRAEALRRHENYDQVIFARENAEYEPSFNIRPGIGYELGRASSSYRSLLSFNVRLLERYDMRKKEAGVELGYLLDALAIPSGGGDPGQTDPGNLYSNPTLTLFFVHAWNLFGLVESMDVARGSLLAGFGFTYSLGAYWGMAVRAGYEWRLGKRWALTTHLQYRPPASVYFNAAKVGTSTGVDLSVGVTLQLYSSGT